MDCARCGCGAAPSVVFAMPVVPSGTFARITGVYASLLGVAGWLAAPMAVTFYASPTTPRLWRMTPSQARGYMWVFRVVSVFMVLAGTFIALGIIRLGT